MNLPFISPWEDALHAAGIEITQCLDEGRQVPQSLIDQHKNFLSIEVPSARWNAAEIIFSQCRKLALRHDFTWNEPDDLESIRSLRIKNNESVFKEIPTDALLLRLTSALNGRITGCALGKPVEGAGICGVGGKTGRQALKERLLKLGEWPLNDFISGKDIGDNFPLWCPASQRENISYMEADDDIHYTLISLLILEKHGADFQWYDTARMWSRYLSFNSLCTAERVAFLNFFNAEHFVGMRSMPMVTPEMTRSSCNPYREWIGAQIRADGYGYAAAGNPSLAAELAYRDACWTHTANGIYGSMFIAAVTAAAFFESDVYKVIEYGLAEIPSTSRLYAALRETLKTSESCPDFETAMDWLDKRFTGMCEVHTINNACLVILSLIYGKGSVHKTMTLAVSGGLDTDCNGATAGSIAGAMYGLEKFDSPLADKIGGRIRPEMAGFTEVNISQLADRFLQVYLKQKP